MATGRVTTPKPPILGIGQDDWRQMSYGDLVASLRKDLVPDLSTDALPHTGNDVPGPATSPGAGAWTPLAPYYVHSWTSFVNSRVVPSAANPWNVPEMFIDANGWVTLRGIIANGAAYANGAASSVMLNLPSTILPRGVEAFEKWTQDGFGNISIELVEIWSAAQATALGLGGNVSAALTLAGTNNGTAVGFINLHGIRWNYRA